MNEIQQKAVCDTVRAMTMMQAGIILVDELPKNSSFRMEMKQAYNRLLREFQRFEFEARKNIDEFNKCLPEDFKLTMFNKAQEHVDLISSIEVFINENEQ